jgi:TolB protein
MAASRVAFVRQNGNGTSDMLIVDSDGENLRRIMGSQDLLYSPGWSPDGTKLAYASPGEDGWQLNERDMATGRTRILDRGAQLVGTPVYTPDGSKILFARWLPGRGTQEGYEIHEYDVSRNCCLARLTDSNADNIGPSLSPDGRRFVFMSTRTGRHHIYAASTDGSGARIITPFGEGVEYNGPDWSPISSTIVFEGMSRGTFQIMTANADRPGGQVTQLTSSGDNKDPSWAPDGRHIVYTGSGAQGEGLYVIDTVTGTVRLLARGARLKMADWSPLLAGAVSANN